MLIDSHAVDDMVLNIVFPYTLSEPAYGQRQPFLADKALMAKYMDAVEAELDALDEDLCARPVQALRLSGGASIMSADQMLHLVKKARKTLSVQPRSQIAVDVNPLTVGTPSLTDWTSCGVNRVNLNVWSVRDVELSSLGATHTRENTQNAFLFLQKFHMNDVNVRLLYGLPEQTLHSLKESVQTIAALSYPHVTVLPFIEPDVKKAAELPGEDEQREMYQAARELLEKAGYSEYLVGSFVHKGSPHARDGFDVMQREGAGCLSLGAGARSRYDGFLYENVGVYKTYVTHSADFQAIVRNPRSEGADARQVRLAQGQLDLLESFTAEELAQVCGNEALEATTLAWLYEQVDAGRLLREDGRYSLSDEGRFQRAKELGREILL